MVRIKDIAEKCNVSISMVSRVVRNVGYVSKENRKKIEAAIKEMGYVADENARVLKNGQTRTIGIIVSDINNFFYNLVLEKIVKRFKAVDYKVVVTYSFENKETEKENFLYLVASKVDAIIFTPITSENEDMIRIARKNNIFVLQLFRSAFTDIGSITVDDAYGAYLATKHLLAEGRKNIVLLSVNVKHTPHRSQGYINAYEEAGLEYKRENIYKFSPNYSIKKEIANLIQIQKPDAIIAGTNTFGIEVLEAFRDLNIDTTQIALIVFDEFKWLDLLKISTIAQPIDKISEEIYNYLIPNLEKQEYVVKHLKVIPRLIIRK